MRVAALHGETSAILEGINEQLAWACKSLMRPTPTTPPSTCSTTILRLVEGLRGLRKHVNETYKLTEHALSHADKVLGARRHSAWDNAVRKLIDTLTFERDAAIETTRQCLYIFAQAVWLQSHFPDAELVAVPGPCAPPAAAARD